MNRKVLLVTLEGLFNFGNRLQHYALQTAIEKCGYQVDSLMVKKEPTISIKSKIKRFIKTILAVLGNDKFKRDLSIKKRALRFMGFNSKLIHNIVRMPIDRVRCSDWGQYAFAVTGSDQVWHNWHTKVIPDELSFYYLEFIEKSKRISYAPSFGFTTFPAVDREEHRRGLSEMQALSCREQEGCELIEHLTGRKAKKVLDPTLLLSAEDWISMEKKPSFNIPDHYNLLFFLGDIQQDYQEEVKRIEESKGLKTLNINNPCKPKHYVISPDEFVWLVHHAEVICTDSFHASVFSVLFERNLRVFKRKQPGYEEMFGRIYDLLNPLELMGVVYGEGENLSTKLNEKATSFLQKARAESYTYLRESLNTADAF